MTDKIVFTLDGKPVSAAPGETIWDVAKREGTKIPHLCHVDLLGYRFATGNGRSPTLSGLWRRVRLRRRPSRPSTAGT